MPDQMKERVDISTYSTLMSLVASVILIGVFFFAMRSANPWAFYMSGGFILLLYTGVLIFMPMSLSVDNDSLDINRSFCYKSIPLAKIESVELCQPTMGAHLIFGSNGWFGYWGWFSEKDLGKYFASYGKASDCFLVRLKDGRQYMLGCRNPKAFVDFLKEKKKRSL